MQGSDHKIRYQTLHDNKYIRYFGGHTERVTGLCLSPKSDMFLSAGQVKFLFMLWNAHCALKEVTTDDCWPFVHGCMLGMLRRTEHAGSGTCGRTDARG